MSTCRRCHRTLKTVRHTGTDGQPLGPVCARRERAEARFKAEQVEKAHELIELGAIARAGHLSNGRVMFRVIASSGERSYLTSRRACTCDAGRRGRACYHRLATVLAA